MGLVSPLVAASGFPSAASASGALEAQERAKEYDGGRMEPKCEQGKELDRHEEEHRLALSAVGCEAKDREFRSTRVKGAHTLSAPTSPPTRPPTHHPSSDPPATLARPP